MYSDAPVSLCDWRFTKVACGLSYKKHSYSKPVADKDVKITSGYSQGISHSFVCSALEIVEPFKFIGMIILIVCVSVLTCLVASISKNASSLASLF